MMKIYENAVTHATIEVSDDVIVEGENWQPVQPVEQPDEQPAEKGKKGKKVGKKAADEDEHD